MLIIAVSQTHTAFNSITVFLQSITAVVGVCAMFRRQRLMCSAPRAAPTAAGCTQSSPPYPLCVGTVAPIFLSVERACVSVKRDRLCSHRLKVIASSAWMASRSPPGPPAHVRV
jgi:hypothetical protein